jgi:hypothetical protein
VDYLIAIDTIYKFATIEPKLIHMRAISQKCLSMLLVCILSIFMSHQAIGKIMNDDQPITLHPPGGWGGGGGNGFNSMPALSFVSVSIDGSLLHIQCTSPTMDVTVCIIQDGVTVYQDTVPATDTDHIWVDLSGYTEGMYMLDLTNSGGGHVYGLFNL